MSPVKGHFFAQDVLAFKVTESHTGNKIIARGNYEGDLPGIIRPVLEWQSVKKLNNRGDK
jgi:lipopolysaccharide transport system ATP-binding protein